MRFLDIPRIDWYRRFFAAFHAPAPAETMASIARMGLPYENLARRGDLVPYPLSGVTYWVLYIKGYLEKELRGSVEKDNPYYRYLTECFGPQNCDPGMTDLLAVPARALERVALRYRDFAAFHACCAAGNDVHDVIDPVLLVRDAAPSDNSMMAYEPGRTKPLAAISVDGYHRVFLARFFGIRRLRCRVAPGR